MNSWVEATSCKGALLVNITLKKRRYNSNNNTSITVNMLTLNLKLLYCKWIVTCM